MCFRRRCVHEVEPCSYEGLCRKRPEKNNSNAYFGGTINLAFSVKLIISRAGYYSALHQCSDFCYYFEAGYSSFCSVEQTEKGSSPRLAIA